MDEFLDFMMVEDPSQKSAAEQRMLANRLREQMAVGALGSTSQIAGARGAGQLAMQNARSMGRQMGNRKAENQDRQAGVLKQALRAQSSKEGKPNNLTRPERDKLTGMSSLMGELDSFASSFKPEYANRGNFGPIERATQKGMTNFPTMTKMLAGSGAGGMLGIPEDVEQLEEEQGWWGIYERINKIPERAAAFGATLTNNEQSSWDSADINPGMSDAQIKRNLRTRLGIVQDKLGKITESYRALKFPEEALEANVGDLLDKDRGGLQDNIRGGTIQESIEAPTENSIPQGVTVEEWMALTPDMRREYYENIDFME